MKWLLLLLLVGVVFGDGGRRTVGLFGAIRRAPSDFKRGRDAAADPASVAREVQGRVVSPTNDDER